MLRKLTLALVAAASLSADGAGSHRRFREAVGRRMGLGWRLSSSPLRRLRHRLCRRYGDDGCYVTRRVMTPFGYRLRTVNVCDY